MVKSSTQIGETVFHFRIFEKPGVGMSVVYKEGGTSLCRFVALKSLPDGVRLVPFDGKRHELCPKQCSPGLIDPASVSVGVHQIWVF